MIAAGGIIMVPLPAPPGRQRPNGRFRDPILGQEVAMAKTSADLVEEAKQRVQNLTVDQVAVEIEQGDALLVDLREPSERQEQGAIPGAVHAPRGMLEFWADPTSAYHRTEFDPNRRVIVHCAGGGRSALAADTLQQMGYANVAHLDGGFNAWKTANRPVEDVEST
jgi:rhodanese-related sulfurtransferase